MTKAPRAGAVKTRLVPPLTFDEAAGLSICFLRDTASNIACVAAETAQAEGLAVYTPVGAERAFDGLLPTEFKLVAQRGESFGERLSHATEDLLALGYSSVCLIDSDSPTLPSHLLAEAVRTLAHADDRVVLGPAEDGGYYLIGLKARHRRLFEDIAWSTNQVMAQTVERAREIGLRVSMLQSWYDVDDAAALGRLCDELFIKDAGNAMQNRPMSYAPWHTHHFLTRIIETEGRERIWPRAGARRSSSSSTGAV